MQRAGAPLLTTLANLLRGRVLPWVRHGSVPIVPCLLQGVAGTIPRGVTVRETAPPSESPKVLRRGWAASHLWVNDHLCAYRFAHLAVVLEGVAEVRIGQVVICAPHGTWLFVSPSVPIDDDIAHAHWTNMAAASSILWLLLAPFVVRVHVCFTEGYHHWGTPGQFLWLPEAIFVADLLQTELTQRGEGADEVVAACLTVLLWRLLRATEGVAFPTPVALQPLPSGSLAHRVQQILLHNLQQAYSPKKIAQALGISPSYLRHRFKAETGRSLRAYTNEVRLQLARLLLQRTDLPIAVVAQLLGFGSPFHFTRWFRRNCDVPPSTLRRPPILGRP